MNFQKSNSIALGIHPYSKHNTECCINGPLSQQWRLLLARNIKDSPNMPSDTRRDARTARDSDATGNTTPRGQDKEKTKSKGMNGTLDGWVEPSLAAKPSFEDHGGAPYGVLEHMQPLGEPPSTRVRARVKGDGARKSLLGKGGAGAGPDAQETPEGTPGPQSSQAALEPLPPLPPIAMDDSDDEADLINGEVHSESEVEEFNVSSVRKI